MRYICKKSFTICLALFVTLSCLCVCASAEEINFFDRYDGQKLMEDHYTGDCSAYLKFLYALYWDDLVRYDSGRIMEEPFYNRELKRAYNHFPHQYLTGVIEENGEVTITGLKARSFYVSSPADGWFTKYDVFVDKIVIPDEIEGHPVTQIADRAFEYRETGMGYGNADVILGDNVRVIGKSAFYENEYIHSITFGKNVEEIGSAAFWGCCGLESIKTWGEHLQTIAPSAFGEIGSYTEKGTSLPMFPKTLKNIESKAFLNAIVQGEIIIPETVQRIGILAFATWNSIQSLVVLNRDLDIEDADTNPLIPYEKDDVLYCYAQSSAEANAKQFGYTYYLIDGESLLFDGEPVEGDVLHLDSGMTEAELLPRLVSDGTECEVRLGNLCDGKVVNGSTVTLWNTAVDAEGKVYTVQKAPEIESVVVATLPKKTSYAYKEVFDPEGLSLTVQYDDGKIETVTEGYTLHSADNLIVGKNTVGVLFGGKAAAFDITVHYTWWQYLIRIFLFGWLWY